MAASPFEILQRQARDQVRSQAQKETARVCRELTLAQQIRQAYGWAGRLAAGRGKKEGPAEPVVCADGYRRRSPVQPFRCPAGKNRARRAWLAAAALVLAVLLAWLVWKGGLLPV